MTDYVTRSLGHDEHPLRIDGIAWPYHLGAWLALIFLGILVIGVIIFLRMHIWMLTTKFAVTDRRVLMKTGWLSLHTQELALTAIEEIEIDQGFWGRLFNFGRVRIGGSGAGHIVSPPINDPVGFRALLGDARDAYFEHSDRMAAQRL
ncbi:PH domain-containing protein [Parvularcula sp. LCG005]|uniref:PH domain-containing protein n=1 Tax=Parvularcula sp. LCG005 TaxID=3078805 RepID=UPI0029423BCD|nr:PH domain-containing protein [Parvularcula sp. LCG005]WOI52068.1 PH domain-containing protein [Parvularcula sp. LCG005]